MLIAGSRCKALNGGSSICRALLRRSGTWSGGSQPRYDLSRQVLSRFWPRFQASCQPPVFLVSRANYPKSAQPPRHVPDRRKSARQMLLPPLGALHLEPAMSILPKTCEIGNALNPFGSWLLEKRCKLGSTASLASTTSQH